MKTTFLKTSCLILLVVVAFVYFANPIYSKASTADMDYIETDMSTAEVKALFSGAAAFIPAAFIIIGFIVLMYCTLRNINTPIDFSTSDSFFDKCSSLGHYAIDNLTDPLKDFVYSVYQYCDSNNVTSITTFGVFSLLSITKFFSAISKWIDSSLISGVSAVGVGLLEQFKDNPFLELVETNPSVVPALYSNLQSFNTGIDVTKAILSFAGYGNMDGFSPIGHLSGVYIGVEFVSSTQIRLHFYHLVSNTLSKSSINFNQLTATVGENGNVYSFTYRSRYQDSLTLNGNGYTLNGFVDTSSILANIMYYGGIAFNSVGGYPASISLDDVNILRDIDVTTPASDNIYIPVADAIPIDLVGTWSDLKDSLEHASDVTQEDKIAAYVPRDIALQLDAAVADSLNVVGGNYVFPSLKGVWKYAEYFYNTLKGWGQFVGGCLNAVTVGEGGLSWLFYGGFIILVCGGVVGKILLG